MILPVVQLTPASFRPFPLFRNASEHSIEQVVACAQLVTFVEDQPLWRMGDAPDTAHFILHGLVQVLKRLPNGDEASFALFGTHESVGLLAVLGDAPGYPADAVAASAEVHIARVPASVLKGVLEHDPEMARAANIVLARHAQLLRAKIDVLTAGEIPQRLATLLTHLAERFGDESAEGEVIIPVALSRRMLARLVGAREETVIRVMTKWARERVVETEDTGFVVHDFAGLARVMDGADAS